MVASIRTSPKTHLVGEPQELLARTHIGRVSRWYCPGGHGALVYASHDCELEHSVQPDRQLIAEKGLGNGEDVEKAIKVTTLEARSASPDCHGIQPPALLALPAPQKGTKGNGKGQSAKGKGTQRQPQAQQTTGFRNCKAILKTWQKLQTTNLATWCGRIFLKVPTTKLHDIGLAPLVCAKYGKQWRPHLIGSSFTMVFE